MIVQTGGNPMYYSENGFDIILLDCIRENNELFNMLMNNKYIKTANTSGVLSEDANAIVLNEVSIKDIKEKVLKVLNSLIDKVVSAFNYAIDKISTKLKMYRKLALKYEVEARNGAEIMDAETNKAKIKIDYNITDPKKLISGDVNIRQVMKEISDFIRVCIYYWDDFKPSDLNNRGLKNTSKAISGNANISTEELQNTILKDLLDPDNKFKFDDKNYKSSVNDILLKDIFGVIKQKNSEYIPTFNDVDVFIDELKNADEMILGAKRLKNLVITNIKKQVDRFKYVEEDIDENQKENFYITLKLLYAFKYVMPYVISAYLKQLMKTYNIMLDIVIKCAKYYKKYMNGDLDDKSYDDSDLEDDDDLDF